MTSSSVVTLIGILSIRPGNADKFEENCEAMVVLRNKEPGHLASAYSFSVDKRDAAYDRCHGSAEGIQAV